MKAFRRAGAPQYPNLPRALMTRPKPLQVLTTQVLMLREWHPIPKTSAALVACPEARAALPPLPLAFLPIGIALRLTYGLANPLTLVVQLPSC